MGDREFRELEAKFCAPMSLSLLEKSTMVTLDTRFGYTFGRLYCPPVSVFFFSQNSPTAKILGKVRSNELRLFFKIWNTGSFRPYTAVRDKGRKRELNIQSISADKGF